MMHIADMERGKTLKADTTLILFCSFNESKAYADKLDR